MDGVKSEIAKSGEPEADGFWKLCMAAGKGAYVLGDWAKAMVVLMYKGKGSIKGL